MVFLATILHCKAKQGKGQTGLMRSILLWIMPQLQNWLLDGHFYLPTAENCLKQYGKAAKKPWGDFSSCRNGALLWEQWPGIYLHNNFTSPGHRHHFIAEAFTKLCHNSSLLCLFHSSVLWIQNMLDFSFSQEGSKISPVLLWISSSDS